MSKLLILVANTVIGLMFLSGSVAAAEIDNSNSTTVSSKELMCLARNIYYESGNEPEDGMIAVGMVTLNRVEDPRWPKSVCEVVRQRTVLSRTVIVENKTIRTNRVVCQFSWVCSITRRIKETDHRWIQSMEVAKHLLDGGYELHRPRMGEWLYFHASHINPRWTNLKRDMRIGGHIFYVDK